MEKPVQTTESVQYREEGPAAVLIADDDEMGRFLLETILEDSPYSVLSVTNGKEAVEAFENNHRILLAFMDIKMPVMDGLTATQKIKAFRPDASIIAVTAYAMSGDEQKIREAGCDDYISKPFSRNLLLDKLSYWMSEYNKA